MKKLSVIVPVYNVAPYIEACINSLFSQTYTGSAEFIIVDDRGGDDSMDIVRRLLGSYTGPLSFLIAGHDRNRGLSAARNTGLDAATGDYVFFLDSDDELPADALEKLSEPLEAADYDIVAGDIEICGGGSSDDFLHLRLPGGAVLGQPGILHTYRRQWNMMAQAKLYRRDWLLAEGLRFREGLIHEDELFSFEAACAAQSLCAVASSVYIYKLRRGSIVNTPREPEKTASTFGEILREASQFASRRHLGGKDVFRRLDAFLDSALPAEGLSYGQYSAIYRELRRYARLPLPVRLRVAGPDLRRQADYFHYVLPPRAGAWWHYHVSRRAGR